SNKAVVLGFGINPSYGKIDPYKMGASVIDESLRNLVAAGGDIKNAVLLDNFCFGDVANSKVFATLFETVKACYDYAKIFKTPFISGKDSLNNFFTLKDSSKKRISIPPTLLISSLSVIDDYNYSMTSNFKEENNYIYLVGETKDEIGGSVFSKILEIDGEPPEVNGPLSYKILKKISDGIRKNLFLSVHDLSEGGLAVGLAEMCFSNEIGCEVDISFITPTLREDILLFSESNSRFLLEVKRDKARYVERHLKGIPFYKIGETRGDSFILKKERKTIMDVKIRHILDLWEKAVKW
ncbi:MAG: AIR synthase-related protein, partial [candidate division WOR-3 bacterium]